MTRVTLLTLALLSILVLFGKTSLANNDTIPVIIPFRNEMSQSNEVAASPPAPSMQETSNHLFDYDPTEEEVVEEDQIEDDFYRCVLHCLRMGDGDDCVEFKSCVERCLTGWICFAI